MVEKNIQSDENILPFEKRLDLRKSGHIPQWDSMYIHERLYYEDMYYKGFSKEEWKELEQYSVNLSKNDILQGLRFMYKRFISLNQEKRLQHRNSVEERYLRKAQGGYSLLQLLEDLNKEFQTGNISRPTRSRVLKRLKDEGIEI